MGTPSVLAVLNQSLTELEEEALEKPLEGLANPLLELGEEVKVLVVELKEVAAEVPSSGLEVVFPPCENSEDDGGAQRVKTVCEIGVVLSGEPVERSSERCS